MKTLPTISNYGHYNSDNYGAHTLVVDFDTFSLYYSYKTIVAYYDIQDGLVVSDNVWGTTTGKHINWIDNGHKGSRLDNGIFEEKLQSMLARRLVGQNEHT